MHSIRSLFTVAVRFGIRRRVGLGSRLRGGLRRGSGDIILLRQGGAGEQQSDAQEQGAGSLGGLHLERIVEAVEVVEQSDGGGKLDDFAFVEVLAKTGPEFVVDAVGVEGFALGQFQGGFFTRVEIGAGAEVGEVCNLLLAPAIAASELGVRGEAVVAVIESARCGR